MHVDIDYLDDCDIIFGLTEKRTHWLLLNHVIIAGKQIIDHNHLKNYLPLPARARLPFLLPPY